MRYAKRRRKSLHYTCLVCFEQFSSNIQYVQHTAQHNTVHTYPSSVLEESRDSNAMEQDTSSPTNFGVIPVTEVDPLDISIISENSTEPETIVIDEDSPSPDIVTVDRDSEQERAVESLLINSSPESSNDRPEIVSYDFTCDICYDIFCSKEELESHMELHSQIEDRNIESQNSDTISAESPECQSESRERSLPRISENASPFQVDSMTQVGSPQERSIIDDNIDSFMANFLRPAGKKSPQIPLEVQSAMVHNFFPEINKRSDVSPQEQLSRIPSNSTENQVYYMDPQTIGTNQNLVSDADGNVYLVVGCSVANGAIQNTVPMNYPYQESTTPDGSVNSPSNFVTNHHVASHDNILESSPQSLNQPVNDRPTISLARLNQNIEQMKAKDSSAPEKPVFPKRSFRKNEDGKKVLLVKQKLVMVRKGRNKIPEFEIIEESCSPKPAKPAKSVKGKANILKNKIKKVPSQKKASIDSIPTLQQINSDDSNSVASGGPFCYVDHQQEEYSHYSNLKNALLHGANGVTFQRKNKSLSSQTNQDEAIVLDMAAESVIPSRKSYALNDPFPNPIRKVPTVDRILMPKITNVMSMNSDIMESDSITVLSDEETEAATSKIMTGLNTNCDDDDDDIERALPMSLIYRPETENTGK